MCYLSYMALFLFQFVFFSQDAFISYNKIIFIINELKKESVNWLIDEFLTAVIQVWLPGQRTNPGTKGLTLSAGP